MRKKAVQYAALPPEPENALKALGHDIRRARVRRGIRIKDMAKRCLVSEPTMSKVEYGDPTVSFGTVVHALWVLGMSDRLTKLLAEDAVGESLEERRARKRVRRSSSAQAFDF